MTGLAAVFREIAGLFVEDNALAVGIVAVVILAALSSFFMPGVPLMTGGILLLGTLGVLAVSVWRAFGE